MKTEISGCILIVVVDALNVQGAKEISQRLKVGKHSSIATIIPPFSFEPDEAYLCGKYPEETDSGTHFWYRPEESEFKIANYLRWCDSLPLAVRKVIRRIYRESLKIGLSREPVLARIPFGFLSNFSVVHAKNPDEKGFSEFSSIFDLLRKDGKKWIYLGVPKTSGKAMHIIRELKKENLDKAQLVYLFIGDIDSIGHKYGPHSEEYTKGIEYITEIIDEAYRYIDSELNLTGCLIFGDHGMVEMNDYVDLASVLAGTEAKVNKDYTYFLDSTLARFWFFTEDAKKEVMGRLSKVEGGRWLVEQDRDDYRIRYKHNRYGDEIWWVDGGKMISPNFWQEGERIKGMHGYRKEVEENHAGAILIDPDRTNTQVTISEPLDMVDVHATIIEMLGLELEKDAYGKPFGKN